MKKSMRKLLDEMEPQIRRAFEEAINDVKSQARLTVIAKAIEENRVDDVLRALALSDEFFAPLDDAMRGVYLEGGRQAIANLPSIPDPF